MLVALSKMSYVVINEMTTLSFPNTFLTSRKVSGQS